MDLVQPHQALANPNVAMQLFDVSAYRVHQVVVYRDGNVRTVQRRLPRRGIPAGFRVEQVRLDMRTERRRKRIGLVLIGFVQTDEGVSSHAAY